MAERSLAVSLVIGGAVAPSLARSFRSVEQQGARSTRTVVANMTQAKIGEQLADDVIKYKSTLTQLQAKQQQLGTSSARLNEGLAESKRRYSQAKAEAKAYGITIGNVVAEHRQLGQAARFSEGVLARQGIRERNRTTRQSIQGEVIGAVAPVLALAKPIKEAIKFETVLSEINKVVDFKSPDGLANMSAAILRLSTDERIPLVARGIGEIIAAAGQSGKVANHDLIPFARSAAKIGVAFDLSGKVAGSALVGLKSIFELNQRELDLVADSYNHLSNNMDATAAGILRVMTRSGPLGKMMGLTAGQVGALASTFIALKTPPEVAATGINALLTRLRTADAQPKRFQDALEGLGLTASELKESMQRDAQGTLVSFLKTVDKADDKVSVLAELFGAEYADDIAKLVGGLKTYEKALGLVGDQAKFAGSAQREYEARAKTTANDLQILANQGIRAAIMFGNTLLPALKVVSKGLGQVTNIVGTLSERFPFLTKVVGLAVIGIVALKVATLGAKFSATLLSDAWMMGQAVIARLHPTSIKAAAGLVRLKAASVLGAGGLKGLATTAIPTVIAALKGLTLASVANPIGAAVAGIVLAAVLIVRFWQPIKAFFIGVWRGISETVLVEGSAIKGVVDGIVTAFKFWVPVIKSLFGPVETSAGTLNKWAAVGRTVGNVIGFIVRSLNFVLNPFEKVNRVAKASVAVFEKLNLFSAGKAMIETFAEGAESEKQGLFRRMAGVLGGVTGLFPQSDAKEGPLSNLTKSGRALVLTLGEGVRQAGSDALAGPLRNVLGAAAGGLPGPGQRPTRREPLPVVAQFNPAAPTLGPLSSPLSQSQRQRFPGAGLPGPTPGAVTQLTPLGAKAEPGGEVAISKGLRDALTASAASLSGLQPAAARDTGGTAPITVDMSGMTIYANTAADAAQIGNELEARVRNIVEGLSRGRGAVSRGALHDGDSSGLGSL